MSSRHHNRSVRAAQKSQSDHSIATSSSTSRSSSFHHNNNNQENSRKTPSPAATSSAKKSLSMTSASLLSDGKDKPLQKQLKTKQSVDNKPASADDNDANNKGLDDDEDGDTVLVNVDDELCNMDEVEMMYLKSAGE